MRHNLAGSAKKAAAAASVPIINAGDGPGQHPTQVLSQLPGIMCPQLFGNASLVKSTHKALLQRPSSDVPQTDSEHGHVACRTDPLHECRAVGFTSSNTFVAKYATDLLNINAVL